MEFCASLIHVMEASKGTKIIVISREKPAFYNRRDVKVKKIVAEIKLEGLDIDSSKQLLNLDHIDDETLKSIYSISHGHPLALELMDSIEAVEYQPDFNAFIEIFERKDLDIIEKEEIIEISFEDDTCYIKDNIVIEKTEIVDYFNQIIQSMNELDNIVDSTANILSKKCFEIIESIVKPQILQFSKELNPNQMSGILPELYFLNKFKLETEIESGLIFCNKCNRWYPIIETIPQMLPDEFRNEEKEIKFLQNNKNLLDEEFFKQDLKPFGI